MSKTNCWEFKQCSRESDGTRVSELGVCPAAVETRTNGINNGINAGRACWAIAGTLCGGQLQGTFAMKLKNCLVCDFYKFVQAEEAPHFINAREILEHLQ